MRTWVMMMFYKYGRGTSVSAQFAHDGKTGKEGSSNLGSYIGLHPWHILHINFTEDVGEEFHAMIIIDGHELVILLLGNLMADTLAIDDSGHAEEGIAFFILLYLALVITDRRHLDVIDLYLSTMLPLAEPSFAFVYLVKAVAIYMGYTAVFGLDNRLVVINQRL